MMESRNIRRNYGLFNYKFFPTKFGGGRKHDELWLAGKYQEAKDVYIPYCEDRLHFIRTYVRLTSVEFPIIGILILLFLFLQQNYNLILFIVLPYIILNLIGLYISRRWWWIMITNYSWSITGINSEINEKFGTNTDVDFDELGEMYLNEEIC